MTRLPLSAFLAAALVLLVALGEPASGANHRSASVLQLDATLRGPYGPIDCTPGAPDGALCYSEKAAGPAAGLGMATQSFTLVYTVNSECGLWRSSDVTLTIGGKGAITATAANTCQRTPSPNETMQFTVTGGSGLYAGATGSGTIQKNGVGDSGRGTYHWRGAIAVPGLDFDTTPPVIAGITNRTITIAAKARSVRVSYAPTAQDAVDGSVRVICRPRSGSLFALGGTAVFCSATDASANTKRATFTVTIKHSSRRHA